MFVGEYRHALDDRGRLFIPPVLREGLGDPFIITRGLDRSLFLFPQTIWQAVASRLLNLSLGRSDARAMARFVFSGATTASPDGKGRVLLPVPLREHAALDREAVVIGAGDRVEVWAQDCWRSYAEAARADFDRLAEGLAEGL